MRYLALGDSISIDDYTGVKGGGAASQFAQKLQADDFLDAALDGNIAEGVLQDLADLRARGALAKKPDLVTLTIGGNDLLVGRNARVILAAIEQIAAELDRLHATVILNTVYDPTDGDDTTTEEVFPLSLREPFNQLNMGLKQLAARHGYLVSDLETLFHGHGLLSEDTWYTAIIEPNYKGATAIAEHWYELVIKRE